MTSPSPDALKAAARQIRTDVLGMCYRAQSSHIGSSLSCVDIFTTLYIGRVLKFDAKNADWPMRDYFILSKGHASAVLYATLARAGFFPAAELETYYQNGSKLPGHPSKGCMPGIEVSTGSLGHGLGLGCGMASALKMDKKTNRVFVVLSDGELDEGSVWEAVLFAGARKMGNVIAIIDYNKLQSFGRVEEVLPLEPLEAKFRAFGWETARLDGNDIDSLLRLFSSDFMKSEKPKAIIADTVKGQGVSFMMNRLEWHYKSLSKEQYDKATKELMEDGM